MLSIQFVNNLETHAFVLALKQSFFSLYISIICKAAEIYPPARKNLHPNLVLAQSTPPESVASDGGECVHHLP